MECSVTYFASGGGQSQGWYFWLGWSGNTTGSYHALGAAPPGHSLTLQLQYNSASSQWGATYTDHTQGTQLVYAVTGATGPNASGITSSEIIFENGGDYTCSDYSTFGGITFSNLTFYDSSGNSITFTNSVNQKWILNLPNKCGSGLDCININSTNLSLSRNC